MEWLRAQWNDIKGNAKWWLVTGLGGLVILGVVALTHGMSVWQQVTLAAGFVYMLLWASIATWGRRRAIRNSSHDPAIAVQDLVADSFESSEFNEVKSQILCSLNTFERIAVKQLLIKHGITGNHFYSFINAHGFPIATREEQIAIETVFEQISRKTTLLQHNLQTDEWTVKDGLAAPVEFVLFRISTDLGAST